VQCNGPAPFGKMQMLQVDDKAFDMIWQSSVALTVAGYELSKP
jgi:hypothetical protein